MIFDAFPKLNIFLKITGTQGAYHTISSRFVIAFGELKDVIEIKPSKTFCLKGDFGCEMEQNLIYRAIIELKNYLISNNINASALDYLSIEVEKKIPKGGGLGGGSADAGMVLVKINELLGLGLSPKQLLLLGGKIGCDVGFFVSEYVSANICGVGEIIDKYEEEPCFFEIFTPDVFCHTQKVYLQYDKTPPAQNPSFCQSLLKLDSKKILSSYKREELNDLLLPAINLYPELEKIQKDLGAEWFFSGSGSSFFRLKEAKIGGKNESKNEAKNKYNESKDRG